MAPITSPTEELLVEQADHILTITLNRPDRLNAISGPMLNALSSTLQAANIDPEVRVVVLTGAGRGFCAGLDLKDQASGDGLGATRGYRLFDLHNSPPIVINRMDKPLICALNGAAAGYGMDLALGCDLVIASDTASFTPPVKRGVIPESGGTWLLPRLVGWQKACEITLLARKLDSSEMLRLGLVNVVVPHDDFEKTVAEWVAELAGQPPLAVAAAKRTMRLGLDSPFEANAHHVLAELMGLFRSKDFGEAVSAFLEKRDPTYEGR